MTNGCGNSHLIASSLQRYSWHKFNRVHTQGIYPKDMKILVTLTILMTVFNYTIFGQKEKLQSGDSVRVALERESISQELIQLRDSIQLSLISFDVRLKKASSTLDAIQLSSARKELVGYQDKVKIDLEEVSQTSQNGWGKESVERLRTTMTATRRHHKRICLILQS